MKTVHDIATEIVAREGGFVDDPDDPGGVTNHGVTLTTLRRLGIDLDGDGRVGRDDLRRLTPVKEDGSDDPSRPVQFVAETQLMSQMVPLPVSAHVEAATLKEPSSASPRRSRKRSSR